MEMVFLIQSTSTVWLSKEFPPYTYSKVKLPFSVNVKVFLPLLLVTIMLVLGLTSVTVTLPLVGEVLSNSKPATGLVLAVASSL